MKLLQLSHKYKWPLLAILAILAFAFLLRSHVYLKGDFLYLIDQARDLLLVKEIAVNHDMPLIGARSGLGGIFHGPLWLFMLVPTFILSGGDPYFTLVPVILFISLLTVLIGILVGWKLYGMKYGLLCGLFLSISQTSLASVANFSNAHVMPLIFLLFLFSIILYMRGKEQFFILSIFLIGIGIHFEVAFAVFLFPITLLAMAFRRNIPKLKTLIVSLLVLGVSLANYILFELKNGFLMSKAATKLISGNSEVIKGYEKYADVTFRIGDRIRSFIDSFYAPLFTQSSLGGILIFTILIGAIVLLGISYQKKKLANYHKEYIFILLIPLVIFSLFIIYPHPIWSHYILPLYISSVLAFVLALKIFITSLAKGSLLSVLTISVIVLPALTWVGTTYFSGSKVMVPNSGMYKDQEKVAEWIFNDAGEEKFGYLVYTPRVLTYQMDYLMWWKGSQRQNTNYINNKFALTYLILTPPDEGDDKAHTFWKENVIYTKGKVIKRQKFPNGMVVEKTLISEEEPEVDPNYLRGIIFR